jgi:ABC-type nitrate/sulfonate/bicarbonate transport system substrate-binding protein
MATLSACGGDSGGDASLGEVEVVAFQAPSLGAFLPVIIEDQELDLANDIDLTFAYVTPDNYNTEFAAGHYQVGASAAPLSEALRTERDGEVTYMFNLFDYFGTVVTMDDSIQSLTDLDGHTLAAATGTTNYAMFEWFADRAGLDLDTVEALNQTTPGLSTMASTVRTDATQLWEPAYSTLVHDNPDLRTIDIGIESWQEEFDTDRIPYLGVAAQLSWVEDNAEQAQALYDTYVAAAEWTLENPTEAAELIAAEIPGGDASVIEDLIANNDTRLRMHVTAASELEEGLQAVFEAGQQTGYLSQDPPESIVYDGLED